MPGGPPEFSLIGLDKMSFGMKDNRLREYIVKFREFVKTKEYKAEAEERDKLREIYQELLDPRALEVLTELEFSRLISIMWAWHAWGNKAYVANRIIEENGLETLREALRELLWSDKSLEERYDNFSERIKGIGPASVTEILAFTHPKECGLWNDKSRKALEKLGFGKDIPFLNRYRITGEQYVRFNKSMQSLAEKLRQEGLPGKDLLDVDAFLYFVWRMEKQEERVAPEKPGEAYDFDHDEIVDKLLAIGQWMGFEAEKERWIAKGARVDVVWRARIANLGVVTYVFEVQRSGSVDSLILNLQKALNNPSVQRLVVVANTRNLKRIEGEISMLDPKFTAMVAYLEARDVERAAELLEEFAGIIEKLELVRSEF